MKHTHKIWPRDGDGNLSTPALLGMYTMYAVLTMTAYTPVEASFKAYKMSLELIE